jgi:hypothetical protein
MNKVLEKIKELAEEIRKNPEDVDGVVDMNTTEIIELCKANMNALSYEKEASHLITEALNKERFGK